MADQVVVTKQLAAASANAIALSQSLGAAGQLTLNGAAVVAAGFALLDTQRRVIVTSAGNDTGIFFTVVGANGVGAPIQELVTGANGAAAATLQDFISVTSVHASGATAAAVTVGTNTVGSSPWLVPNFHITPIEIGLRVDILSGSANWTIEFTEESPMLPLSIYAQPVIPIPVPVGWPGMAGLAVGANGNIDAPIMAWRLTINSGLGLVRARGLQSGIRN